MGKARSSCSAVRRVLASLVSYEVLKDHLTDEPHTRLECRSSPYYQNTALYPITDFSQRALTVATGRLHLEQHLEKLEREL